MDIIQFLDRSAFSVLIFGSYLKLRRKLLLLQAEQLTEWQLFSLKMDPTKIFGHGPNMYWTYKRTGHYSYSKLPLILTIDFWCRIAPDPRGASKAFVIVTWVWKESRIRIRFVNMPILRWCKATKLSEINMNWHTAF